MGLLTIGLLATTLLGILSCTAFPTAMSVPDPSPALSPRQVLEKSSAAMIGLDTASFTVEHEAEGSSELFPGVDLMRVEGQVDMPDRFKLTAEAQSRFPRSFLEVDVVVVGASGELGWQGATAYITDFINRDKWTKVPPRTMPFNFTDLGRTLSDIIIAIQDPSFAGTETVDDAPSWRVKGVVPTESLETLVPSAEPGFQVGLELWVGQGQGLLRKVRIVGPIRDKDQPDVVRVLRMYDFDKPVEISVPPIE